MRRDARYNFYAKFVLATLIRFASLTTSVELICSGSRSGLVLSAKAEPFNSMPRLEVTIAEALRCRNITTAAQHNSRWFWTNFYMFRTGFFIGSAACLAIGLTGTLSTTAVGVYRQPSPALRERLSGFETIKGDWRAFRDLLR